jgi:pseudoazurin
MHSRLSAVAALAAGMILFAGAAGAAEVDVKMLNRGAAGPMVFEPAMVRIVPGDTVHFIATDKGHDVMSVDGMIPDGAQPFVGEVGEDLTVTFAAPGVYGFKCKPHYAMGMVGVVVVGDPVNLDAAKAVKQPGRQGGQAARPGQEGLRRAARRALRYRPQPYATR